MILPIVILVVLVVIGAVVVFAMKSKSAPDDKEFLSAEEAIAAVGRESQAAAKARAVQADAAKAQAFAAEAAAVEAHEAEQAEIAAHAEVARLAQIEAAEAAEAKAADEVAAHAAATAAAVKVVEAEPASDAVEDEALLIVDIGPSEDPLDAVDPDAGAPSPVVADTASEVRAEPTPAEEVTSPVAELAPEPMVRARLTPPATVASDVDTQDEDPGEDDEATLSRFTVAADRTKPHLAATPVVDTASRSRDVAAQQPEPVVAESVLVQSDAVEADASEIDPAVEPEPVVVASDAAEPEPAPEPEIVELEAVKPEPEAEGREPVVVDAPAVGFEAAESEAVEPEVIDVDLVAAAVEPDVDLVGGDLPVAEAAPIQLVPQPESDPVDHVLKALINRAKDRQVGIAEVAAELVEQANLEDRDIDEVLADLVDRVDEEEPIAASDRLEELTLFNDSVPRRPGQLTDFDRLDKNTKKRVIIRVLCLLVAMQEDNRLTPSEPRSEAETRHWPLSRAVWPVPAQAASEANEEPEDGKPQLPGRRLIQTKP